MIKLMLLIVIASCSPKRVEPILKKEKHVVCTEKLKWLVMDLNGYRYAYADTPCGRIVMNKQKTGSFMTVTK